jgi:ribosomal protection tetracycline resistance protein
MGTLNIGILAHVDAGKTSLTERILYTTGVIRSLGSVDKGTTQTDTMELERARGITIKSAVVSFQLGDLKVNLIDTPGHADFVAEVERSLRVLDAVVLVVSSVEGVQPQTRRLAQAIRAAGLPLLIFVNKIDRVGARIEPLLDDIARKLKLRIFSMSAVSDAGTRSAAIRPRTYDDPDWRNALVDALAEANEAVIEEFERTDGEISPSFLEADFRSQIAKREITPVYFGSAITGAGVGELLHGIETLLPAATDSGCGEVSGAVFKVARRSSGERIVYLRIFADQVSVRTKVDVQRRVSVTEIEQFEERVTAIDRFVSGATVSADVARAGDIVCLHGLKSARIGDTIGVPIERSNGGERAFPPPSLESVVRAVNPAQVTKLRSALEILADQDPLISLRQRNLEGEISVHLYGEVQKEVIADTLAHEFGVEVTFGPSQTICIERPTGIGEAFEVMGDGSNPFAATVGFRVEPGAGGSGITYSRELGSLPLAFYRAIEETVYDVITQGLFGWNLTDAAITLTHTGYSSPVTVAADFRMLTPLVIMNALERAGTEVCEPIDLLELEIPEDTFSPVCSALIASRATITSSYRIAEMHFISCEIPSAELRSAEQQLPGLTRGDAGWTTSFAGYRPVSGDAPVRERVGANPLNRAEYLASVGRK